MASIGRKKVVASRRQREDEGEEEGSVAGELEDDSLSEGSIISNGDDDADIEASDISDGEVTSTQHHERGAAERHPSLSPARNVGELSVQAAESNFVTSSDTKAMMNGLQPADRKNMSAIQFDEAVGDASESAVEDSRSQVKVEREGPAERGRREHLEYLREKKENPAFVPNRGGFFLHDNRAAPSGPNGPRTFARGRGRGAFSGFQQRYVWMSSFGKDQKFT